MWKSTVAVNDNDTLASAPPIDTHDVIDKLLATNSNVKIITTNLARLSQDLNRRNSILRTITSDSNASNNLRDILSGLKSSSGQFTLLANRLNEITEKINLDKGVAGILFHDTVIANRLRTTISSLQQAGNNAADITKRLDESISQTHNPNTVGMLMTDSVMASQLKQSIINLEESARKLDENMDALQHSFLLRRYFKKQNKNR